MRPKYTVFCFELRKEDFIIAGFLNRLFKKKRKYPMKRDESGRSARQRAFDAFESGLRPAQVALEVGITLATAFRYHYDWKQKPKNLELRYRSLKKMLKNDPAIRQTIVKLVSSELGISERQVLAQLQKPWAVHQLVTGRWRMWNPDEEDPAREK